MLNALALAALIGAGSSWTQILLSSQLQCRDAYSLTVGYPQGEKELVARVEQGGKTVVEKKLGGGFANAEGAVFDADESQCEEALVDLAGDAERVGLFLSFPGGKPKLTAFPAAPLSASKAKRTRRTVRVFSQKKGKLCVTDYKIAKDDLAKTFEDCY